MNKVKKERDNHPQNKQKNRKFGFFHAVFLGLIIAAVIYFVDTSTNQSDTALDRESAKFDQEWAMMNKDFAQTPEAKDFFEKEQKAATKKLESLDKQLVDKPE